MNSGVVSGPSFMPDEGAQLAAFPFGAHDIPGLVPAGLPEQPVTVRWMVDPGGASIW